MRRTVSFPYHGWALCLNLLLVSRKLNLQILVLLVQSLGILVSLVHFAGHVCNHLKSAFKTLIRVIGLRRLCEVGLICWWLFEQNSKRFIGLDKLGNSWLFEQSFSQTTRCVQNRPKFLFKLFISLTTFTLTIFLTQIAKGCVGSAWKQLIAIWTRNHQFALSAQFFCQIRILFPQLVIFLFNSEMVLDFLRLIHVSALHFEFFETLNFLLETLVFVGHDIQKDHNLLGLRLLLFQLLLCLLEVAI